MDSMGKLAVIYDILGKNIVVTTNDKFLQKIFYMMSSSPQRADKSEVDVPNG